MLCVGLIVLRIVIFETAVFEFGLGGAKTEPRISLTEKHHPHAHKNDEAFSRPSVPRRAQAAVVRWHAVAQRRGRPEP